MVFDYFYREQSDQYAFYRIPKALILKSCFEELSTDAKLLYGLLLDRVSLSSISGWVDEEGRVYIIYTIKGIMRDLHCGTRKAVKLLKELEALGLIEKKHQGQGKPTLIYVKNFSTVFSKEQFKDCQKENQGIVKREIQDLSKGQSSNTEFNNTDINNTYPILSGLEEDNDERESLYLYFREQLEIDILKQQYKYEEDTIEGILELIVDTLCTKRKTIRIAGDEKPVNVVKSQFMKLNSSHVQYVMTCLQSNTTKVRNIKQYILATLYNAPLTMSSYYRAEVNHDFPQYAANN